MFFQFCMCSICTNETRRTNNQIWGHWRYRILETWSQQMMMNTWRCQSCEMKQRGSSAVRPSWGLLDWLVSLWSLSQGFVLARMAALNPSTQQKVPPSEGQWQPEQLSFQGVARREFSRACAPSNATVYAFQPPQVFKEEPSSTTVPNESVKKQPWL